MFIGRAQIGWACSGLREENNLNNNYMTEGGKQP
jgi:hypothetical protein